MSLRASMLLGAVAVLLSACMLPVAKATWHDRLRVTQMRTIAVLPLENLSDDEYASGVVSGILSTSLYGTGRFNVMEHNEAVRRLREQRLALGTSIDMHTALAAGKALGVDGVVYGTITEFMYLFYPQDAVVGLSLNLVDVRTQQVVWTGLFNHRNRGFIQGNDDPITDLARSGVANLVAQLAPVDPNRRVETPSTQAGGALQER